MKTKMLSFIAVTALMAGCSLFEKANTIDISTDLTADIPVVVPGVKKSSEVAAISFTKTQDLSLSGNTDIEPYLSKIKDIALNSLMVTVNGLSADQTINSISLDVQGVGTVFTQSNITMVNNNFTPMISPGLLDQVAAKLTSDKKITLTVSGNVSGAMTFTVSLDFETVLTAKVL
jgi:type IV pilus biogenesis protein CpaD/CtpE